MLYRTMIVLLLAAVPASSVWGQDDLTKFFTREEADSRLEQISDALTSFAHFTDLVRLNSNLKKDFPNRIPKDARIVSQFSGEDLLSIDNLDWESQNLGFANWPNYVKGYMDYQAYENLKLKLEIAVLKKLPESQIKALRQEVAEKEKALRNYLSPEAWAD